MDGSGGSNISTSPSLEAIKSNVVFSQPASIAAPSHRELLSHVRTLITHSQALGKDFVAPAVSGQLREEATRRAKLQDAVDRLERRQTEYNAQVAALNAQLEQARCHRTLLSAELQTQRQAAAAADEALTKARLSNTDLQHQMEKLRVAQTELKSLEIRLASEVESRRRVEEQFEEMTAHEQALVEKVEALQVQVQQMRLSLSAAKADRNAVAKRFEEGSLALSAAEQRMETLNERLAETTGNYQQALQDIVRLTSEKQKAAESAERYDAAAQTLLAVQKENQTLVTQINKTHESQSTRILELSRDLQLATEESRDLRKAKNTLEDAHAAQSSKYEELKLEVANLCESLQTERSGKRALEYELENLREVAKSSAANEQNLRQAITAEVSAETHKAFLDVHNLLKAELAVNAALRTRIAELEEDLKREQIIRHELSDTIVGSSFDTGDDHVMLRELRAENELLWCRLDESRERDSKLRAEIEELKEQLFELRGTEAGLVLQELKETRDQLEAVRSNLAAATMDTNGDATSTASGSEGGKGRLMESLYAQIDALQKEIAVIGKSREELQQQARHSAASLTAQKKLTAELEAEVTKLQNAKLAVERRLFDLESVRSLPQQQQQEATPVCDQVNEIEQIEERHLAAQDELKGQISAQQEQVDEMERVALNMKTQYKELELQISELNGHLEDAMLRLQAAATEAQSQSAELEESRRKEAEALVNLDDLRQENVAVKRNLDTQKTDTDRQRNELDSMVVKLKEKEVELVNRDAEIASFKLRVADLTETRERMSREQIAMQSRLETLERECERLTMPEDGTVRERQLLNLQEQLDATKLHAAKAIEAQDELQAQLDDVSAKLAEAVESRGRARSEADQMRKDRDQACSEMEACKRSRQLLEQALSDAEKSIESLKAAAIELGKERQEREASQAACRDANAQIETLNAKISNLERQLNETHAAVEDQGDVEELRLILRKQQLRFFEELKEIRRIVVPGYLDNYSLEGLSRLQKRFVFQINELLSNGFLDEIKTSRLPIARTLEAKDLRTEVARLETHVTSQANTIGRLRNEASNWEKRCKAMEHQEREELRIKSTLLDRAEADVAELRNELVNKESALKKALSQQHQQQHVLQQKQNCNGDSKEKRQNLALRERCQVAEAKLKQTMEEVQKDHEAQRIEADELRAMLALMQHEKTALLTALSRCKWLHWVMILFGAAIGIFLF